MQKEYQVTLHSQLGPRDGRLSITSSGGSIAGVLTLLGFENPVTGRENGGGGFTLISSPPAPRWGTIPVSPFLPAWERN